jgi:hypothetical protein
VYFPVAHAGQAVDMVLAKQESAVESVYMKNDEERLVTRVIGLPAGKTALRHLHVIGME